MAMKGNNKDSFEEHNERMGSFRESHGHAREVRAEGYDKPPPHEEAMHSFRLAHENVASMESGSLESAASLLTLSPALSLVQRVMLSVN